MASDCLLQSVFGDFVLAITFHGKHSLEPVGTAFAPQNIGTIRETVSPNGSQRSTYVRWPCSMFFAHGRPWAFC